MLTWYFDVISPFSWLALPEVEAIGGEIDYQPVLFSALLKHWGQLGPAEIGPKRLPTYRLCVWIAAQRGIPFRMPPVHPFNPLAALRLLHAVGPDRARARTAMEVVWHEGRDVSAPDGLAYLAERLGIADPAECIEASGAREKLRAATDRAIQHGVFGVPTLEVDRELFWGVDAMPLARAYIDDPETLSRGEMGRLAQLPGMERSRRPAA